MFHKRHQIHLKRLTVCAFMDKSVRERRHELLMAASFGVAVAFLRL